MKKNPHTHTHFITLQMAVRELSELIELLLQKNHEAASTLYYTVIEPRLNDERKRDASCANARAFARALVFTLYRVRYDPERGVAAVQGIAWALEHVALYWLLFQEYDLWVWGHDLNNICMDSQDFFTTIQEVVTKRCLAWSRRKHWIQAALMDVRTTAATHASRVSSQNNF